MPARFAGFAATFAQSLGLLSRLATQTAGVVAGHALPAAPALDTGMLDALGEGVCVARAADLVILHANPALERMYGFSRGELGGASLDALDAPDAPDEVSPLGRAPPRAESLLALRTSGAWQGESRGVRSNGERFWRRVSLSSFEHPGLGVLYLCVQSDIDATVGERVALRHAEEALRASEALIGDLSARKRAEAESLSVRQELIRVARVWTMAELATSIAHELNQPLTAILNNARAAQRLLAQERLHEDDLAAILADIVSDDQRAAGIISHMRALLEKGIPELEPIDANEFLREATRLLKAELLLGGIAAVVELTDAPVVVQGDRVQMHQVVLNLAANAIDAMQSEPAMAQRLVFRSRRGDASVHLEIEDSGPGLAPERLEHLFRPFSSAKRQGMGMGLAISRRIVEAHGGRIAAKNNPERGCTFVVTLPLAQT